MPSLLDLQARPAARYDRVADFGEQERSGQVLGGLYRQVRWLGFGEQTHADPGERRRGSVSDVPRHESITSSFLQRFCTSGVL